MKPVSTLADPDMKSALIASGVFHILVIVAAFLGLPHAKKPLPDLTDPPPIAVEFVSAEDLKKPKAVAKPKPPKPKPPEPKKAPTMKAEAPPNLADKVPLPPKEDKAPPPPEEQVEPVPAPPEKLAKPLPKKPKPPKPPKPELTKKTPKPDNQQFSSLLKNLMEDEPSPDPSLLERDLPKELFEDTEEKIDQAIEQNDEALKDILSSFAKQQAQQPAIKQPQPRSFDGRLNLSEIDRVKKQLGGCWHVLSGARYAENLTVEIRLFMNPDRTVRNAVITDQARYNRDALFKAAADSALRALKMPACQVLDLPPEKFNQWETTTITFDPQEML